MNSLSIEWKVNSEDDGKLLRQFLREDKLISKRALADVKFSGGAIFVNGEESTVRRTLVAGDVVLITFPDEVRSTAIRPEEIPLEIIYEDDHFLIVNKPAGMATIPSREHPSGTLANAVLAYYDVIESRSTFHAVNRLDRDTSGIVVIAKHRYAHDLLSRQQKDGRLKRQYLIIAEGQLPEECGTIRAPIGRKDGSIIEREVREDGQHAITHYKVVRRTRAWTVASVKLETGRTHQIRVHFSSIGHPLAGDDLYGGRKNFIERQALHSIETSFYHPFKEKTITLKAPIPIDLEQFMG
ncbi:RluA family pseudouridine synthase [Bacillus sp. FJAT-45350]|uniref:RluA family pseudouridine synthase n=1 Tax=Bacillus sp. FJAT-45350 TaxID=2011014 RepID=UPI000BB86D77|nr:RluA family pseudouridine synthase [Bacillus sp. FJAT-45350]